MKQWFGMLLLASLITVSGEAWSQSDSHCNAKPESGCWKSLAEQLAMLKPAGTQRELEDRVFDYWMLAKSAYLVGDFSDAGKLYDLTQKLANDVKPPEKEEFDPQAIRLMLGLDRAALAMSIRDYASALSHLDAFNARRRNEPNQPEEMDTLQIMRCAALIGLHRKADAESCLRSLLDKLRFDAVSPVGRLPNWSSATQSV